MSDTSEGLPEARPGIGIGTIFRLLAIALGIMSVVLLARSAFGIRLNEDFLLFLDVVREIIGGVVLPFELLIVKPVVRWLHEQGWVFELRDHWRNAFVLLWLFFAAEVRVQFGTPSDLSIDEVLFTAYGWAWAAIAALIGGTLAGTAPLDHSAVLWWPLAAWYLYRTFIPGNDFFLSKFESRVYWDWRDPTPFSRSVPLVLALLMAAFALGWVEPIAVSGEPPVFWWAAAAYFGCLAGKLSIYFLKAPYLLKSQLVLEAVLTKLYFLLFAITAVLALGVVPGPSWLDFQQSPSPGLANLTAFVVILAAWYAVTGGAWYASYSNVRNNGLPGTLRTALDVFAVLGGAAFLVWLGNALA